MLNKSMITRETMKLHKLEGRQASLESNNDCAPRKVAKQRLQSKHIFRVYSNLGLLGYQAGLAIAVNSTQYWVAFRLLTCHAHYHTRNHCYLQVLWQ